jgi:hypothetical protein
MLSQFAPPLWTDALAVKLVALVAVTDRVCEAGAAVFSVPLKVNEVGAKVRVPAAGFTTRVTDAVRVTLPETTEMVPL